MGVRAVFSVSGVRRQGTAVGDQVGGRNRPSFSDQNVLRADSDYRLVGVSRVWNHALVSAIDMEVSLL
jgi:hypothetical protein